MFKLLRYFLVIKILLAVGGMGYLYFTRVEKMEKFLSNKLNADVSIKDVKLGWKRLTLHKLKISHSHAPLLRADVIEIVFSPWELWKREVRIEKVKLQNPIVGLLLFNRSGSENNWASSMKESVVTRKKFVLETLKILNLRFEAQFAAGKGVSLPAIPYVELHDLGRSKALSLLELEKAIFGHLVIREPSLGHYFGQLPDDSGGLAGEGLFDMLRRRGSLIVDGVRGLF